jgi:hypothetical protein
VSCSYDISGGTGSYDEALAAFAACEGTAQPDGYCSASISSAEFLSNQHVCASKSPQLIQLRPDLGSTQPLHSGWRELP